MTSEKTASELARRSDLCCVAECYRAPPKSRTTPPPRALSRIGRAGGVTIELPARVFSAVRGCADAVRHSPAPPDRSDAISGEPCERSS